MSYSIENIPAVKGMLAGMGVNMMTGETTTQALTIATTASPSEGFNATSMCIQTAQDYSDVLKLLAQAEGSAWTEDGDVSISANASYLSSANLNTQSLALLLYRSCTTTQYLPTAPQLNAVDLPSVMAQAIVNSPSDFLTEYGTHVIVGFIYGGSYLAGIKATTVSAQDMNRIQSAFSAALNAFELGNGQLDASLQSSIDASGTMCSCTTLSSGIGVAGQTFSASNVQAIQEYMDSGFMTELGDGIAVTAVCYPWEMLPCVANLTGYVPGSLSPGIYEGALTILNQEYQQLSYGIQTAEAMQQNNCCVGPQAAADLENDLTTMASAQATIGALTFTQLQTMTAATAATCVVSPGCINDLTQIANGRTTLNWYISLDGGFTPNSASSTINGSTSMAVPTSAPVVQTIMTSSHGTGTATLGYVYRFANTAPGTQLQSQVALESSFSFGGTTNTSAPVAGTQWNFPANANWPAYPWNAINIYFGSSTQGATAEGAGSIGHSEN